MEITVDKADKFTLTTSDMGQVVDSLDESGGFLIKGSELKYWIEYFVNRDRERGEK